MRRPHRRHHARIGLHFAPVVDVPARRGGRLESSHHAAGSESGAVHSGAPASRWRLQYLSARARRDQRNRKSLLRAQAGGNSGERSAHDSRPRVHSGARRPAGGQQLRQDQFEPVRSVPARFLSGDPAGAHSAAGEFLVPDVVLDARDRDVAGAGAGARPASAGAARILPGRATTSRYRAGLSQRRVVLGPGEPCFSRSTAFSNCGSITGRAG